MPADPTSAARSQGAPAGRGQGVRDRGGDDQRAARRGRRPGRPWTLGGRPDPRARESAIGTLVERTSRFTMLLRLPPMTEQGPRVKNGPALAGHGAEAVRDAIAEHDHHAPLTAPPITDLGPGHRDGPTRSAAASRRACRCTSAIRTAHGSAAPTRTATGCCASTSRKASTSSPGAADDLAAVAATPNRSAAHGRARCRPVARPEKA